MKYYLNPSNFSNPKASNFLTSFRLVPTEKALADVLVIAADAIDFVEPDTVAVVLVAAEIVAASFGRPSADFPDELLKTVNKSFSKLTGLQILTLDAVLTAFNSVQSDLRLPSEVVDFAVWEVTQEDLLNRLGS